MTRSPPKPAQPASAASRRLWSDDISDLKASGEVKSARTAEVYAAHVDPWQLSREQARFAATNAIIERRFGRIGRMLEIGCGEGYQSTWLGRLCDRLVGVDVSPHALERARQLLPEADFLVASLPEIAMPPEQGGFDLAVACEVLYFADDIGAAVKRMRQLAPRGLVTALSSKWRRFAPAVDGLPGLQHDMIEADGQCWRVASWSESD